MWAVLHVALEHTSVEVVACSAGKWTHFHLYRGRKIDLLLSGLHNAEHGDGFTVVNIMPPTLPQAETPALSGCFVRLTTPLHRCVSVVRSWGINIHSMLKVFVIGQGRIYPIPWNRI